MLKSGTSVCIIDEEQAVAIQEIFNHALKYEGDVGDGKPIIFQDPENARREQEAKDNGWPFHPPEDFTSIDGDVVTVKLGTRGCAIRHELSTNKWRLEFLEKDMIEEIDEYSYKTYKRFFEFLYDGILDESRCRGCGDAMNPYNNSFGIKQYRCDHCGYDTDDFSQNPDFKKQILVDQKERKFVEEKLEIFFEECEIIEACFEDGRAR